MDAKFEDLKGMTIKVITGAESGSNGITITTTDDKIFIMQHDQDCCEVVEVEDVCGDIEDIVGSPILLAEEVSNNDPIAGRDCSESFTWTFYKLVTNKGAVTIRWLGQSNGYYSESVSFERIVN